MSREKISSAISNIDLEFICEAETNNDFCKKKAHNFILIKWGAAVACAFILVVCIILVGEHISFLNGGTYPSIVDPDGIPLQNYVYKEFNENNSTESDDDKYSKLGGLYSGTVDYLNNQYRLWKYVKVESVFLDKELCDSTAKMYLLKSPSKIYERLVTLYSIKDCSIEFGIAVRFEGYDGYLLFADVDYAPDTLGELTDELKLSEAVAYQGEPFINLYYYNDPKSYDYLTILISRDDDLIQDLLFSERELPNRFNDESYHRKRITFSLTLINSDCPITFIVTDDGYLIAENTHAAFFIGKEKANEFMEYATKYCESIIEEIDT